MIRVGKVKAAEFPFKNAGVQGEQPPAGPPGAGNSGNFPGPPNQGTLPGGRLPPHLQGEREGGKFGGFGNYGAGPSKEVNYLQIVKKYFSSL